MKNRRKKILFVITKSNFGGAQRYVFDLATHVSKNDFEVVVAFGGTGARNAEVGLLEVWLNRANIRTIRIANFMRNVSLISDIRALFELISLFRNEQPDVVHLNSSKSITLGALAARIAQAPNIIGTVHGWAFNETRPWWQQTLISYIHWIGVVLCHTTIVVSENDRTQALRWKASKKIIAIHNGIGPIDFKTREEARRELGISHDTLVIGSIGELEKNKNFAGLVEAFARTEKEVPHGCSLHIIGDGDERERLATLVKGKLLSNIIFHGFIPNAARLLRAYDIFVLPSQKEGLPYVLLEAGFAELAVVSSRVGGIPEIIEHKKTGFLIDPNNAHELSDAIKLYCNNMSLRQEHGTALLEKVRTEFPLAHMVEKTSALY